MRSLYFLVINLHIIVQLVFCQVVEYYPARSSLGKFLETCKTCKVEYEKNVLNTKSLNQHHSNRSMDIKGENMREHEHKRRKFTGLFHEDEYVKTKKGLLRKAADPVFHGHPKTREELWREHFLEDNNTFDQTPSLIKLLHNITLTYLNDCIPVVLYDNSVKIKESYLLQNLFKNFPLSYIYGHIEDNDQLSEPKLLRANTRCLHFIVLITNVKRIAKVIGKQPKSKVVVVARSSQWAIHEFLAGPLSRMFVDLIVIGQSFKEEEGGVLESPYILYTHELYTDGLGASKSVVINSWAHGKFSIKVNLFQPKMTKGYAGHRFVVAAADQPPFIFRRMNTNQDGGHSKFTWDGIEVRLLKLLAERNNFSLEIIEPREVFLGSGDAVIKEVVSGKADIAAAGIYITRERIRDIDLSFPHSQDCSVFITLMSTALPRYRAILGPFHWQVWVALTLTYLIGIFPLAFSDKHTLRHLMHNSGEVENMFWYVFGTFTNCFTFVGKNSWSKTTKITTRLLIGWYWIFTIIITSCYTGSIIAFVTLPIFPETVDTIQQLLAGFYRVGTLDHGGWERWFLNSSDLDTNKLLKKLEFVPNVQAGIRNTTRAFFWPYAFLGSQAELEYIVQTNYSETKSKRAVLHISNECFVPFGVALGFPRRSVYFEKLSGDLGRMLQSGIVNKIVDEIRWEIQRSATGRISIGKESQKVNTIQEKGLTLEDTQGMFLLLAAGFVISTGALISEWMGGCSKRCKFMRSRSAISNQITGDADLDHHDENYGTRSKKTPNVSAGSRETFEGQIINVSEESITVHSEYNVFEWDSKRRSDDIDREIQEIFEKDHERKKFALNHKRASLEYEGVNANKFGVFGDSI